jgi:hypothetical protein
LDKREAIHLFLRRYSGLFGQDPFPWKIFRKIKRDFFTDYAKSPIPKDSEIAGELLEGMIRNAQIIKEETLDEKLKLPFLRERIQNRDYYYERLRIKSRQITPMLDVDRLAEATYVEKIREELKNEVKEEIIKQKKLEIKEWDEKIYEKAAEYLSIPSILDGEDYPIPDVPDKDLIGENIYVPWWDRLGLKEDPFRELEGLSRIDRSLYDQIVCKTDIFIKYESMISTARKEILRNTVIYGQFGSGKTTFFDYMNPLLYECKIFPIYVQLGGEFEVRELIHEFKKRVNEELQRLHSVLAGERVATNGLSDEQAITDLMKKLIYRGAKGFVIFIDDLHKGPLEKALGFMSYLQILSSQLRRTTDLDIGFFVAGSTDWENAITCTPKFSGSVDRQERMPPLKIDVAYEAISKRLKAFAKNPENPRQLDRQLVERIFKRLQYNGQDITFRRIMRELVNEFDAGHFDGISANPIQITQKTLDEISSLLEGDLKVRKQLHGILNSHKNLTIGQKRCCFEMLISLYLSNGIPESEIREQDVSFLQQLERSGLLVKVDVDNTLIWKVSKELYETNKKIIQMHNLSMEDYLLKVYSNEIPATGPKPKPWSEEIDSLEMLIEYVEQSLSRALLNDAKNLHHKIIDTQEKHLDLREEPAAIIAECIESLAKLTGAYMVYEGVRKPLARKTLFTLSFWTDFWWSPESVRQFVRAVTTDFEGKRKIALVGALYREAFAQILDFFKEECENSRQYHIPVINLKNDEIELLHTCRGLWRENKYPELAERLVKAVERRLRAFLYDIFTILYGDYQNRVKWLDKDSKKYIEGNVQKDVSAGFSRSRNEFQQLNRRQYRNIMTGVHGSPEGHRNWNCIFSKVFNRWSEKDLDDYLDLFAELNTKVAHDKDDSIGIPEQDYVYDFMQKSTRFLMNINQAYLKLLDSECFRYATNASFSLNHFNDSESLVPIEFLKDEMSRVIEILQEKNRMKIPLDDQEYVEGIFGIEYRKVYAILALLRQGTEDISTRTKFKLELVNSRSSEIRVSINKMNWVSID